MSNPFPAADISWKTYSLLRKQGGDLLPWAGGLFLLFGLANLARALFPGLYVFDPFDQGWLLIPEALAFGPVVALMTHRILDPDNDFSWSRENLFIKLGKAAAYYYVLLVLLKLGVFAATKLLPALFAYVLGPNIQRLYPFIVGGGTLAFLLVYVRLILVYPVLAGLEREPLIQSIRLTRGRGMKIISALLLPAAPVLIPWLALGSYAGDWFDPSFGNTVRVLPIITRSLLQTVGIIILSTGLCAVYQALLATASNDENGDGQ